jgi:protein transport protein SEC24
VKSIDLGSISPLASLTGGDLHFFNAFNIVKHGEKLHYEIYRNLTRTVGRDVIMKARASAGLSVSEYFGGFTCKETSDIELSSIDADKSICFTIKNDEKLKENTFAHV